MALDVPDSETDNIDTRRFEREPKAKKLWRPALAWAYVAICLFDFILAPVMMTIYYETRNTAPREAIMYLADGFSTDQVIEIIKITPRVKYVQWEPLTLQAGGLFHMAMGGILGIGSWTRGKEKQVKAEKGIQSE